MGWLLLTTLLLWIPLLSRSSPFGPESNLELLDAWMAPTGALGAGWAVVSLTRQRAFLELLPAPKRVSSELLAIVASAALPQSALALGAWLDGSHGQALGTIAATGWTWILPDLQLAAWGSLALRARGSPVVTGGLFACVVWVLPGILTQGSPRTDLLAPFLGGGRSLLTGASPLEGSVSAAAALAALFLTNHLLARPSRA